MIVASKVHNAIISVIPPLGELEDKFQTRTFSKAYAEATTLKSWAGKKRQLLDAYLRVIKEW